MHNLKIQNLFRCCATSYVFHKAYSMVIKLTNVSKYLAQNASGMKTMHRAPLEMKTFEYCSLRNFKPTVLNTKRNEEFSPYI